MTPRKQIAEIIQNYNHFLLASHVNPDGDAIGSMAGLGHLLLQLGKSVTLYNQSGLPERFNWISLPAQIHSNTPPQEYEWVIVLDCGDGDRVGENLESVLNPERTINIDHHFGNPEFALYNWVEHQRSSVGEMISLLALDMGLELSGDMAESLYLALVTDTGSFTYSNTGPETLQIASKILGHGLDLDRFNALLYQQWSLNKMHLHGQAMQNSSLYFNGRVGIIKIPARLMVETQTTQEDCEGVVNYIRSVKGVAVAVSIREEDRGRVKLSLRSWGEVDVHAIASSLGGGGHRNAAGATLYLPLQEAERQLLSKIGEVI